MPPSWNWSLDPSSPSAGDDATIDVYTAPGTPVKVEIWIDNVLVFTQTIQEVPGTAPYAFPTDSSGKPYSVRVSAAGQSDSKGGTVL